MTKGSLGNMGQNHSIKGLQNDCRVHNWPVVTQTTYWVLFRD